MTARPLQPGDVVLVPGTVIFVGPADALVVFGNNGPVTLPIVALPLVSNELKPLELPRAAPSTEAEPQK